MTPNAPERRQPNEAALVAAETASARDYGNAAPSTYPYVVPKYDLPFLHIGTQEQLFVDNFLLDRWDDIRRVIVRPKALDRPLLPLGDLPWEQSRNPIVHAALFDPHERKYKLWYTENIRSAPGYGDDATRAVCYAESDDALNWTKPLSDRCVAYGGMTKTNIVQTDAASVGVVLDPREPAGSPKRFRMVRSPYGRARQENQSFLTETSVSPDGVVWTTESRDSDRRHHHESGILFDESIGKFVAYSQYSHHWDFLHRKRQVGRQESDDLVRWSPKEMVLSTEWDTHLPPNTEFHEMSVRKVGGLYIGICTEFRAEPVWRRGHDGHNWNDDATACLGGLYTSRDGKRWQRANAYDEPWLPPERTGPLAARFCIYSVAGSMTANGKTVIPFVSYPQTQHFFRNMQQGPASVPAGKIDDDYRRWLQDQQATPWLGTDILGTIQAVVMRESGWAELVPTRYAAGSARGVVLTRQFVFEGDTLRLNASCHDGFARVEVLDPNFRPYDGFSADCCAPVASSDPQRVWHDVRWARDGRPSDLRTLWNKPVRLRIELNNASLFSLQFYQSGQ